MHGRNEVVFEPCLIVDLGGSDFTVDFAVKEVGVLRGRVVAPDRHLLHIVDARTGLLRNLSHGTVVIEAGHCRELLVRDIRSRVHGDQCVGIRRVTNNQDLDVLAGIVIDGFALRAEDATVGFEQVGPFHTVAARHGTHE